MTRGVREELTGRRFGRLVALERLALRGRSRWTCRCDCGAVKDVAAGSLIRGLSRSCGCLHADYLATRQRPPGFRKRAVDRTGLRYGSLVVLRPGPPAGRHLSWTCRCDCGRESTVLACNLRTGNTTSCGCRKAEVARENVAPLAERRFDRFCRRCGAPFRGTWKQMFCNKRCRDRYHIERRWPRRRHHCPLCGASFLGRAERAYCSEVCKRRAESIRNYRREHGSLAAQAAEAEAAIRSITTERESDEQGET